MPSLQLWNNNWATSIYLSIIYALSTKYNVRRLEDSSYAIWTAILFHLCDGTLETFLMCPQYGLYVSPKDIVNPDDSIESAATVTDNSARGVFVDNCLILPEVEIRQKRSAHSVAEYFRNILSRHSYLIEADLRITKAQVPVLVEQKRPPPRHCDILAYFRRLTISLNEATRQAEEQVHCLFSMPKFGLQEDAIAIATSGPWWKFRYCHRSGAADVPFQLDKHDKQHIYAVSETEVSAVGQVDDDVDDEAKDGFSLLTTPRIASAVAKLSSRKQDVRVTQEESVKLRVLMEEQSQSQIENARRARNAAELRKKLTPNKEKEWEKFAKSVGEGPFTPKNLNTCREFWDANPKAPPFCHVHSGDLDASRMSRNKWTQAMRLGTPVSDQYLQFIKLYLRKLEKSEKARREKAAQDTAGEASGTGGREGGPSQGGESSKHKEKK